MSHLIFASIVLCFRDFVLNREIRIDFFFKSSLKGDVITIQSNKAPLTKVLILKPLFILTRPAFVFAVLSVLISSNKVDVLLSKYCIMDGVTLSFALNLPPKNSFFLVYFSHYDLFLLNIIYYPLF